MALLAYDGERLARLLARMRCATDELRGLSCVDPAAATAMHLARTTAAALEFDWIPLVARIVVADPLSRIDQRRAGIGELANAPASLMATHHGWSVQFDPLGDDAGSVTVVEARALAERLNAGPPDTDDRAELEALARQVAIIGRDPVLSGVFLAVFTEWAPLANRLAGERAALLSDEPRGDVVGLDAVFAGLGSIARRRLPPDSCVTPGALLPDIDAMAPYSAALLTQHLGLRGVVLAQVTEHLLHRWLATPFEPPMDSPPTDVHFDDGPNTADVLFAVLATDPGAALNFMRSAVHDLDILLRTADDPTLAARVVMAATDRATTSAHDAADIIVPLLDQFESGRYGRGTAPHSTDPGWHALLVDIVAPWTMEFFSRHGGFGLTDERREDVVAWLLTDEPALDRLLANAPTVQAGVTAALAARDDDGWNDFCFYLGQLTQLVVARRRLDEATNEAGFDLLLTLTGLAATRIPGSGIAGALVGQLNPFDAHDAMRNAETAQECTLAVAAAAVARALYDQWSNEGLLPDDLPPPPTPDATADQPAATLTTALDDWARGLPVVDGMVLEDRFHAVVRNVLNGSQSGEFTAN
jgi:hypothetical protein